MLVRPNQSAFVSEVYFGSDILNHVHGDIAFYFSINGKISP